eukprot:289750-Pleurochrysis_carterae.AAC.1
MKSLSSLALSVSAAKRLHASTGRTLSDACACTSTRADVCTNATRTALNNLHVTWAQTTGRNAAQLRAAAHRSGSTR